MKPKLEIASPWLGITKTWIDALTASISFVAGEREAQVSGK
jgi:hypothetical protein